MLLWSKSIFSKNFFNLSLDQGINIFVALIITPILFQRLGDENFGLVNLALSIVVLLTIIVSYGYNLNGPIQIINNSKIKDQNLIINQILSLRLIISLLIFLLSIPFIIFFVDENLTKILIFSFFILLNESLNPLFYLQGNNKIFPQVLLNFFSKSIYIFLIINYVNNGDDAYLVNFFYGLSITLIFTLFWINYSAKNNFFILLISINKLKDRLRENFQLFLSSISTHFTINSPLIILSFFTSNSELGRFTLAFKVAFVVRSIPVFFVQSGLQNASKIYNKSKTDYENYLSKYFKYGLLITFLIAILMVLCSDLIIKFFASENIQYSSNILSIMSFIPFLAMLNFKNIIHMLIKDYKALLNKATFYTLIFMILTSIFLSYYFSGYGLAFSLILTEIFSFFAHSILLKNVK